MPNIMIHEEVGYYISKKININSYDYFLGLMAPDAPNIEGFAKKDIRWTAHQRMENLSDWKKNLKEFYEREKENFPRDFILGYYIHILTDIIFDEVLYQKVRKKILEDGCDENQAHYIMGADMDKYYFSGIERIYEILRSSNTSYNILNIDRELLTKWKNKIINTPKSTEKTKYITDDIINILNEAVFKELFKQHVI